MSGVRLVMWQKQMICKYYYRIWMLYTAWILNIESLILSVYLGWPSFQVWVKMKQSLVGIDKVLWRRFLTMLTHSTRTKIDPLCDLSISEKLNYIVHKMRVRSLERRSYWWTLYEITDGFITGHSGIPVVEHKDDLESEILQFSAESLGEMSWLYNGRCGIVQSPSIDDLEADNYADRRINISLISVSWLVIYLHNLPQVHTMLRLGQSATTYVH